jgi:hypothetical protein
LHELDRSFIEAGFFTFCPNDLDLQVQEESYVLRTGLKTKVTGSVIVKIAQIVAHPID